MPNMIRMELKCEKESCDNCIHRRNNTIGLGLTHSCAKITNYDVLTDRILSLIERWNKAMDDKKVTSNQAIEGLLLEINDDYTKSLIVKEENDNSYPLV